MAADYLTFSVPLPPSVNHSHRNYTTPTGRRRRVPTRRATDWMADAAWRAQAAMRQGHWTCSQGEPVVVEYFVWWPDRRKRDCSNLEKLLLDSVAGTVYEDDRWAVPRCVGFAYDKAAPRLVIRCRPQVGETIPKWCYEGGPTDEHE